MKLSRGIRTELRLFAFYLANGTLDLEVLPSTTNYSEIFREPSAVEQLFAIWANVLEVDGRGEVTNAAHASRRTAQYIRSFLDSSYKVEPPLEDWETELILE